MSLKGTDRRDIRGVSRGTNQLVFLYGCPEDLIFLNLCQPHHAISKKFDSGIKYEKMGIFKSNKPPATDKYKYKYK